MAANLFISHQLASTAIAAAGVQCNSGFIDLYAGTQPADGNTNTTASEYVLAEFTFSTVALVVSSSTGTAQFANLGATTATSTGIATFYGLYSSSHTRLGYDTVSTASAGLNFNTNNVVSGVSAAITSYALTIAEHA